MPVAVEKPEIEIAEGTVVSLQERRGELESMKSVYVMPALLLIGVVLSIPGAHAVPINSFGFRASNVTGISGAVAITGGGIYRLPDRIVSSGGFRCTETVTGGPFANDLNSNGPVEGGAGCQAGEGVRWDTVELLASTNFKCFGADTVHSASTSDETVVLKADFYEASDGGDESFGNVPMIVSAGDLRADLDGVQNVWIAGVGCGSAVVSFN